MNRDAVIAVVRSEEASVKQAGVMSLVLAGLSARADRCQAGDVDVLIDAAGLSPMDRIGITQLPGGALSLPADGSRRGILDPLVRRSDAVWHAPRRRVVACLGRRRL